MTFFNADTFTAERPVVLSYGLGVDSTAILLRWLHEPASRDFGLDQLTVVTAMTGDEWTQTGTDVETHVLPLLAEHGIRYVQAARRAARANQGIVILDDSTKPVRLHLDGAFKLSDEMFQTGTVPQVGSSRLCSVHAKGEVLDPLISTITAGRPFRHVMGFEATEQGRATKDALFNTDTRAGEYPLIEWGWDRAKCQEYIFGLTGVRWQKSACVFCPFALTNTASRAEVFARYKRSPIEANKALLMEYVATALNPGQMLVGRHSLAGLLAKNHPEILLDFDRNLDRMRHAVYEVRRIIRARQDDPTKMANASRSVRRVAEGEREHMLSKLRQLRITEGGKVSLDDDHVRLWLRRRAVLLPTTEHFYVAAPATVADKQPPGFEEWWSEATLLAA